jgi:hypothetical protein
MLHVVSIHLYTGKNPKISQQLRVRTPGVLAPSAKKDVIVVPYQKPRWLNESVFPGTLFVFTHFEFGTMHFETSSSTTLAGLAVLRIPCQSFVLAWKYCGKCTWKSQTSPPMRDAGCETKVNHQAASVTGH